MRFRNAVIVSLLWIVPPALSAQQLPAPRLPAAGGRTQSLRQPRSQTWTFGFSLGLIDGAEQTAGVGEVRFGVFQELVNQALGVAGLQAEGYSRVINARPTLGGRVRLVSQIMGGAAGVDYNATDNRFRGIFTYVHPLWRGGVFGDGSTLRADFVTGPDRSLSIGFEKTFLDRIPKGVTRPAFDVARLEGSRPLAIRDASRYPAVDRDTALASARSRALHTARDAARNIQRLVVPWVDHTGAGGDDSDADVRKRLEELNRLTSLTDSGLNIDRETARLHDAIDHAFSLAAREDDVAAADTLDIGRRLGRQARENLLAEVIYPYNFTLGQVKEDDTTLGLDAFARGAFMTSLHTNRRDGPDAHRAVALVFDALLEMVEEARARTRREWGTSRFVWLPLQYGLRAEQHDTQAELDKIIEQATKQRFVTGNQVSYVVNEQFHLQLRRTILAAKSYHVLWTHDFRGRNDEGRPDTRGFDQVLHSYLAALTSSVKAYDATGTFPTYIILLDEWFYEVNDGRLWMDLLEDPLRHEVHLSAKLGDPTDTVQHRLGVQVVAMEDSLRAAKDALNAAVKGSALLTDHRRQYGDAWLHNLVKVHVNITNAPDPSFWTWNMIKGFPLPDGWMRDHRKIVFYDLLEANPYSGEAMLTGAGIGEHYSNRTWEDRSLLVQGPVNLRLKAAARDALMKQGMAAAEIPAVLQPQSVVDETSNSTDRVPAPNSLPMMQLQNGTGFDTKEVNVAKAVLYTLMPAGSVIEIPDSIWNGTFWGSALIGAALRGVRVLVIAPAKDNAPADAFGSMIRARELLTRLVMASQILGTQIRTAGGMLRVGIFNSSTPVTDIPTRFRAIEVALATYPWLGDLYPFLRGADLRSIAGGLTATSDTARPKLHLKANFFATAKAWDVTKDPSWIEVLKVYGRQRMRQLSAGASLSIGIDSAQVLGDSTYTRWLGAQSAADRTRMMFYTVMGSANQNDRSMVSDGEAAMVLSQWPAVVPQLDMLLLVGQSRWVETTAQLDSLLPPQGALKTRVAHWFKHVF